MLSSVPIRPLLRLRPVTIAPGQLDMLKALAFVAMVGDHVNKALLHHAYPALNLFGRFAFPLFAWCFAFCVVHHLRNGRRFVISSFLFAALSQWPFYEVLVPHKEHLARLGSLNILPAFLFAYGINRIWSSENVGRQTLSYLLFGLGGCLFFDASYAWQGLGFLLCSIGYFRSGGPLYAAGCIVLLLLCLIPNWVMLLPIVVAVLLFSSFGGLGVSLPRFLQRNALYVGYAGHLWLLFLLVRCFH
jgi:hypothetical protein